MSTVESFTQGAKVSGCECMVRYSFQRMRCVRR
jgi:hypothetical protein